MDVPGRSWVLSGWISRSRLALLTDDDVAPPTAVGGVANATIAIDVICINIKISVDSTIRIEFT